MKRDGFKVRRMAKCDSILLQLRFNAIPISIEQSTHTHTHTHTHRERERRGIPGHLFLNFGVVTHGGEERIRMCYSCDSCIRCIVISGSGMELCANWHQSDDRKAIWQHWTHLCCKWKPKNWHCIYKSPLSVRLFFKYLFLALHSDTLLGNTKTPLSRPSSLGLQIYNTWDY